LDFLQNCPILEIMNVLQPVTPQKLQLPPVWQPAGTALPEPVLQGGEAPPGPLVISVPHGGRGYPDWLRGSPFLAGFRSLEDIGTDLLARPLARPTRPVIIARTSRALVDVNRPPDAHDPRLVASPQPGQDSPAYRAAAGTDRFAQLIRAGYGVVPRLDARQQPLYDRLLEGAEIDQRLAAAHQPYHQLLADQLAAAKRACGRVLLLDIHSMPPARPGQERLADMVFGDLDGRSCPAQITRLVSEIAGQAGFSQSWNKPYSGGWITRHYSAGKQAVPVLQIEINRALYQTGPSEIDQQAADRIADFLQTVCQQCEALADIQPDLFSTRSVRVA